MTTTTTTDSTPRRQPGQGRAMHVLPDDDLGRPTLHLRPWHRMAARCRTTRLDRELAGGTSPQASASLAARAIRLTSVPFRRDLAASVQRILAAAAQLPADLPRPPAAAHPPRVPLRRAQIRQSAPLLEELASHLAGPGPVRVQGVAMIGQLLADGTGPLYHHACRDDLSAIIEQATQALTW